MPQTDSKDPDDPKGLIRESYRIDGITDAECRSILVDWALSLDAALDPVVVLTRLHERYAGAMPGHPMTHLLLEAVHAPTGLSKRRGGRAGRFGAAQTGRT